LVNGTNNPAAVSAGSYTFENVMTNHTIEARFTATELPTWTITASVTGGNGTISPSGDITVTEGGSKTFTITPNTGYEILQVLVDGNNNQAAVNAGSYTFTNVMENHTIVASFKPGSRIGNQSLKNITVYAHQNRVYIVNENNISLKSVQLIDLLGRVLYEDKATCSMVFNVDTPTGLYIVKLLSEEGNVFTTKVYIQ